jgi:hypothetical protein
MTIRPVLAALLLAATPAMAQPASDQAINDFVDGHSAITRLEKIARWEDPICPNVTGLPANFITYITKRILDLAKGVGAPVNADQGCKSNLEVVFTTKPQDLLNSIREKQPVMLGYYNNNAQADQMAQIKHIIQSWHAIQTVDLRGRKQLDSRNATQGNAISSNTAASAGMRTGDGLRSTYYAGIVVANPEKLGDPELGTLGDHIAMLALAQPATFGVCRELPSILDMTNPECRKDAPVKALTKADVGYLVGLYKMDAGASLRVQKDTIASMVREKLATP